MRRRAFLAAFLTGPLLARSQGPARKRVVLIGGLTEDLDRRLPELGFAVGRDVVIERPKWDGSAADLRRVLAEVLKAPVDVIVACGALPISEAMAATRTVPVVGAYGDDPVYMKFATSYAKPGGNLTGLTWAQSASVASKAVEIFKETIPGATAFALFGYAENPGHQHLARDAESAFARLNLRYVDLLVRSAQQLEAAFRNALARQLDGVLGLPDHMSFKLRVDLDQMARTHRIPLMWMAAGLPGDHSLLTYGPAAFDHERRAAEYVARILRGARPGDLAVEQTSRLELGVNLRAAARLDIRIPDSILARADHLVR